VKASVIVVTHAGLQHLDDGLASLDRYSGRDDLEVILVDNGSADRCGETAARRHAGVRVIRSEDNLGFAGGVHLGASAANGDVLVLLNDDAAADDGLVEAHLDVLAAHPEAAVSAGRLVNWQGTRHDFVRGQMTFDVHAFQVGQGWPVDQLEVPETGAPLPFPCGGNMAIRSADWRASGGFDGDLFAYFEDVDLGWRLWAIGRHVVAAPNAVARHRGAATSAALGDFRRGVLFERNALRTFFACGDSDLRRAFAPSVLATFLHRMVAFAEQRPELAAAVADPFGPAPPPPSRGERWRQRLRDRGIIGTLRHALARILVGRRAGAPSLDDGLLEMQLRALHGFFGGLAGTERRWAELDRRRTVPDRVIVERFPRLVVPTYLGDDGWFASDTFQSLLPEDWPIQFRNLDEIIHPDLLK
jgi:GT2 family glycosyltransferase